MLFTERAGLLVEGENMLLNVRFRKSQTVFFPINVQLHKRPVRSDQQVEEGRWRVNPPLAAHCYTVHPTNLESFVVIHVISTGK